MIIKNYNPELIAADFEEMKTEVEDLNIAYKEKYDRHVTRWVVIDIIIALVMAIFWLIREASGTMTSLIVATIATMIGVTIIGLSLKYIVQGPEHVSLTKRMTFAMKFWNIVHNANVLSVKPSSESPIIIKIEYELSNNIVKTKTLAVNECLKSTTATEKYLDVEKGYIILPYTSDDKLKFE